MFRSDKQRKAMFANINGSNSFSNKNVNNSFALVKYNKKYDEQLREMLDSDWIRNRENSFAPQLLRRRLDNNMTNDELELINENDEVKGIIVHDKENPSLVHGLLLNPESRKTGLGVNTIDDYFKEFNIEHIQGLAYGGVLDFWKHIGADARPPNLGFGLGDSLVVLEKEDFNEYMANRDNKLYVSNRTTEMDMGSMDDCDFNDALVDTLQISFDEAEDYVNRYSKDEFGFVDSLSGEPKGKFRIYAKQPDGTIGITAWYTSKETYDYMVDEIKKSGGEIVRVEKEGELEF